MKGKVRKGERGFTLLEGTVVVLAIGVVVAFAAPRISNAMREYRLNIAARQVIDTIKRAKMQAISDSRTSAISIDTANRRIGLVFFNDNGTVDRVEYAPLPEGISFQKPSSSVAKADPEGVKTSGPVSFGKKGNYYQQNFTSRGFPSLASLGDVVSIFIGNGTDYRAITMTGVGGIRLYHLNDGAWVSSESKATSTASSQKSSGQLIAAAANLEKRML